MVDLPKGILCLTFDNMGSAAAVGLGETGCRGPDDDGPAGYPQILDLLGQLDLKASFFLEGWNALHNPDAVREVARRGHEIGLHGWVHEVFHSLSRAGAERAIMDSLAAFHTLGIEPHGFRAPGGKRGDHTVTILRNAGIRYDSSVDHGADEPDDGERDIFPRLIDGDFPNIPWRWPMIDYYQYHMHPQGKQSPAAVEAYFAGCMERAARNRSLCTVIFHAFESGQDAEKIGVIERLLRRAIADNRIEILTAGAVAARLGAAPDRWAENDIGKIGPA